MGSIFGLFFPFLHTWLVLFDKCHFNLIFRSSLVKPTYTLPSSNIILYILPFLYRLLNLLIVNSNTSCTLVTYLLFCLLKFRWISSNFLVQDNVVYNCFLSMQLTSYILLFSLMSAPWYLYTVIQKREIKYSANSARSNHPPFTFTLLCVILILYNKLHCIEYLFVFHILCSKILAIILKVNVSYFLFFVNLSQHSLFTLILVALR